MLLSLASSTGHLLSWFWTHSFLFHCISGKVSGYLSDEGSLKQNKLALINWWLWKLKMGGHQLTFLVFVFYQRMLLILVALVFLTEWSLLKTHFSVHIFICGVNRSGVEARVLASNPWAWVLFSVLMSRRVDLVWRWFSFLSKSFLLGSLVYLCKRTNTPLLLPRTARREGEGGASDPHLFRRKTCPA